MKDGFGNKASKTRVTNVDTRGILSLYLSKKYDFYI